MQLGKAFSYPFQDTKKIFQTAVIGLIPIIGQLGLTGYTVHIIRQVATGQDKELPSWGDFGQLVIDGFIVLVSTIVYTLPGILLLYLIRDYAITPLTLIALVPIFFLGFLSTVGLLRFSAEDSFKSYFEISTNFKLLQTHWQALIGTYIAAFILMMSAYALTLILALGIVTICLSFLVLAYFLLVNGYLYGDLARRFVPQITSDAVFPTFQSNPQSPPLVQEPVVEPPNPAPELVKADHQPTQDVQPTQPPPPVQEAVPIPQPTTFVDTLENAITYKIQVPKTNKFEPAKAESLIKNILMQIQGLIFAIVADHETISWQIWDINGAYSPDVVAQSIKSVYPESHIQAEQFVYPEFTNPFYRDVIIYEQPVSFVAPIKYVTDLTKLDPLTQLVQGMSELEEGERIAHLIYTPSFPDEKVYKDTLKEITRSNFSPTIDLRSEAAVFGSIVDTAMSAAFSGRSGKYEPGYQKVYEDRLHNHLLVNCYIVTQVDTNDVERSKRIISLISSMAQFHDENRLSPLSDVPTQPPHIADANAHKTKSALGVIGSWLADTDKRYEKAKVILSTYEIASLWHLPNADFQTPEIDWQETALPSKELLANQEGIIIGDCAFAGREFAVKIHPDDRETHMNIIGQTGVGKSTFMHNLIHQDIQSGKGVCVLDPHGKLVRDVLRLSIPDERIGDLLVLDLANEEYPPPLNPLMGTGDVGEVVSLLEMVEGKIPPVVSDTLIASFVTISKEENPTVRDAIKLFSDGEYRYRSINQVDDVITQEYWEEYESLSRSQQEMRRGPVLHRLRQFYRNPILHPVFCHPHPLNFGELIRQRKIVLMSLGIDERKVPESYRHLVGATLIKQFQMAAMASYNNPTEYFLYIDEVQNFVSAPLDKIFEEARKYKLRLTVANQYLRQLGSILDSIMGTVGATAVFQASLDDARKLGKYFAPEFEQVDLAQMDKYHAAIKTRYLGNTQPSFKIATRPEPQDLFAFGLESDEAAEREAMLRKYAIQNPDNGLKHVDYVMDWLQERYPRKVYTVPSKQEPGAEDGDSWVVTEDD